MCNLSETCTEIKIEKKFFFLIKKISKKNSYKKNFPFFPLIDVRVGAASKRMTPSFPNLVMNFWMTLYFSVIIMRMLEVSWLVPKCVIVEMQFVRQKLKNPITCWKLFANWGIVPIKRKISASSVHWSVSEINKNTFLVTNAVRKTKT